MAEKPKLEMFGAEAASHPLTRSRAPLAGVIGGKTKGKDEDYADVDNHDHHNHIIQPGRAQGAHGRYLRSGLLAPSCRWGN